MYHYYFLKNTHSYDRAAATLKFLQADTKSVFRDAVLRFLSESFYTKFDHKMLQKEDASLAQGAHVGNHEMAIIDCMRETQLNYQGSRKFLFPSVNATVVFEKNFFYFLFTNLDSYQASHAIDNHSVVSLQQIPVPNAQAIAQIYQSFYLETCFFNPESVRFNYEDLAAYKPPIDFRAQEQIKIILTQQMLQKNSAITHTDIMRINQTVMESKNASLMQKVKSAIAKAEKNFKLPSNHHL